jgi:hypothetical protein
MAKASKIVKPVKRVNLVKLVRKARQRPSMAFKFGLMTLITNEYANHRGDSDFAKYVSELQGVTVTPMTIRHYRTGLGVPQIKLGQQALLTRIAELEAALAEKG